jgi:hypothetical protein
LSEFGIDIGMFEDAAHPQIALKLVFLAILWLVNHNYILAPHTGLTVPLRPGLL